MTTNVFAISDLHLSGRPPFKDMVVFGEQYAQWMERIEQGFRSLPPNSVVINAGDTSWAIGRDEALADFKWLDSLGVKIVHTIGNHDYYWGKKGAAFMSNWALDNGLDNTYFADHQELFTIGYRGLTVAATRGTERFIPQTMEGEFPANLLPPGHKEGEVTPRSWEKYSRRLDTALALSPDVLVSHIPPFNHDGSPNELTEKILAAKSVRMVIYGHRHYTPETSRCNKLTDGVFWVNALCERHAFTPIPIGTVHENGSSTLGVGDPRAFALIVSVPSTVIEGK
jgi:predicted phosphohydrolase